MIYLLKNTMQNYAWGSKTAMSKLFGFANTNNKPQAELWMGAHPSACSSVLTDNGYKRLDTLISEFPDSILGKKVNSTFGKLPFLLKILSADTPLSIQVHPNKHNANKGFIRENKANIPLTAQQRNYKDSNHKPELIYALTEFSAMNGFRHIQEIISLFEKAQIHSLTNELNNLKKKPNNNSLSNFFATIILLEGSLKRKAICELLNDIVNKGDNDKEKIAFSTIFSCAKIYNDDIGLLMPLLLNIITLQPGQAMFLQAQTPHAYLYGTGIEIMANSDNVLRAGLTKKHIDTKELLANVCCRPIDLSNLTIKANIIGSRQNFPAPVADFSFDIIKDCIDVTLSVNSAEILLCLSGKVKVIADKTMILERGQSIFITACSHKYSLQGTGCVVRAYV